MTYASMALVRQRHAPARFKPSRCAFCWDWWPCDASLAIRRVDRLEAAIRQVLGDEETGTGWGPDVTMVAVLQAALEEEP